MNREIKFRGKRKGGTEWIVGDLNHINGGIYIFDRSAAAPTNSTDWYEVDPKTVGQFTGLKDNNEKEIYDGDILMTPKSKIVKVVRYQVDRASFLMANVPDFQFEKNWDIWQSITQEYLREFNFEIIGNIHDNPELC